MAKLLNLERFDEELLAGLAEYVGFASPREKDEYGNLLPVDDGDVEIFLQGVGKQRKPTEAELVVIDQLIAAHDHLVLTNAQRARIEEKSVRDDFTLSDLGDIGPREARDWVRDNVTDLATAKKVLGILAMITVYLIRQGRVVNGTD